MSLLFFSMLRPPPTSTLFPYTTLFRSSDRPESRPSKFPGPRENHPGSADQNMRAAYPANRCLRETIKAALTLNPSDRKSTRLNSSHLGISYAVFCLKKKKSQPCLAEFR